MSQRTWWIGVCVVLAIGLILRLWMLELRPLHHDEGVNGFFMKNLVRLGEYHYDPSNYHGPSLYYLAVPLVRLLGLTTTALRLETVIFGMGVLGLILCLHRSLGRRATLIAAALMAVSPGAVFISRYFIHEMLLLFFTLGIVVAVANQNRIGHAAMVLLVAASSAMMFTTKETANMTVAILLIADYLTVVFLEKRGLLARTSQGREVPIRPETRVTDGAASEPDAVAASNTPARQAILIASVGVVFVGLYLLFFSSFGTHWTGVRDSFVALKVWAHTGTQGVDHRAPPWRYLQWMMQIEAPILLLGIFGAVALLVKAPSRVSVFCALWALGMLAAYSIIPYKTPWLLLNIALPMSIAAGAGLASVMRPRVAWMVHAGVAGALVLSLGQCISLNFYNYDNDTEPYVYAHTVRQSQGLLDAVLAYAAQSGAGKDLRVAVVSPEYWPLPWWFRDYDKVVYWGHLTLEGDPQMLIARADQEAEVQRLVGGRFQIMGRWVLRPGLNLTLYGVPLPQK